MLAYLAVYLSLSLSPILTLAQSFGLECNSYPDVCNTACFGRYCGGVVNRPFHYDPNSARTMPKPGSTTTSATFRRQAIGCVNSNRCMQTTTGLSCDEFPYASTYDGGLGCITQGYTGTQPLLQLGVTHCTIAGQNSGAGTALSNFYRTAKLQNGAPFSVSILHPTTFCQNVAHSDANCPAQGNFNPPAAYYQGRSAPDSTFCPARKREIASNATHDGTMSFVTDDGTEGIVIVGSELVEVGGTIWTEDLDATASAKGEGDEDIVVGKTLRVKSVSVN